MASRQTKPEWELPSMREGHQLPGFAHDFYYVKFYPYSKPKETPVFAIVGGRYILICRPPQSSKDRIEILQQFTDKELISPEKEDASEDYFTCAWTKDLETGAPLLCVAGACATIKIINVLTGKLVRTLSGHGGDVNEIAVSPINPYILASASGDFNVRIWSLDSAHKDQPCVAIIGGDSHKESIWSIAWHQSGRYLLSAGIDQIINMWSLPEFPDKNTGTTNPTRIYYPHFTTSELHCGIIDSISFHGDLILSKAAGPTEERIVLWCINGFSSSNSPPPPSTAPTNHDAKSHETRSAFHPLSTTKTKSSPQYTRLAQFSIPDSQVMWARFALFPGTSSKHPLLAFCNTGSPPKLLLWDLTRLTTYNAFISTLNPQFTSPSRPPFLNLLQARPPKTKPSVFSRLAREDSPPSESISSQASEEASRAGNIDWEQSIRSWEEKYGMGDALEILGAHKEEKVLKMSFTGRHVAFSEDGEWCIVVGSSASFALFGRWGK